MKLEISESCSSGVCLMALLLPTLSLTFPLPVGLSNQPSSCSRTRKSARVLSLMEPPQPKFKDFPYVSEPHRTLMLDLVSTMETRLSSSLLPCTLPPDVQFYQNSTGTSQAALQVTAGTPSSPVDVILGSWIHSKLPSGGALNITSLIAYLKPITDAPIFLFEIIQSSPTCFVLFIDFPPRKDLVLHPGYLKTFYEDTTILENCRQSLEKLPEVKPYISPSLYVRAFLSPSAILVRIETESGETTRTDQIIQDHVTPIAKEILNTWLDFVSAEREVGEAEEIASLSKRDKIIQNQVLEIDLGSTFPRLFGQEVTDRVLGVLRDIFNV